MTRKNVVLYLHMMVQIEAHNCFIIKQQPAKGKQKSPKRLTRPRKQLDGKSFVKTIEDALKNNDMGTASDAAAEYIKNMPKYPEGDTEERSKRIASETIKINPDFENKFQSIVNNSKLWNEFIKRIPGVEGGRPLYDGDSLVLLLNISGNLSGDVINKRLHGVLRNWDARQAAQSKKQSLTECLHS